MGRHNWKKLIKRENADGSEWEPGHQARVCSTHFVDGKKTDENPNPILNLGYPDYLIPKEFLKTKRRTLSYKLNRASPDPEELPLLSTNDQTILMDSDKDDTKAKETDSTNTTLPSSVSSPDTTIYDNQFMEIDESSDFETDHVPMELEFESEPTELNSIEIVNGSLSYRNLFDVFMKLLSMLTVLACAFIMFYGKASMEKHKLEIMLKACTQTIANLRKRNLYLRCKILQLEKKCTCEKPLWEKLLLTSDEKVNFYTGVKSLKLFEKIYSNVQPFVRRRWSGITKTVTKLKRNFSKPPARMGPNRKLNGRDEQLLCLMRLRLGLLSQDLQDRFKISSYLCSTIFSTWLRALSQTIGKWCVFIPDQGTLNLTKPPHFNTVNNLHSIIDGTEFFIETPKDHKCQKQTWSSYKHHNTMKALVAVAPNSSIIFVSKCYGGSISDKKLTNDCGYLDKAKENSTKVTIMADKGFNIAEECAYRHIDLMVPPVDVIPVR